ncbi:aspartate aminotransferase family protein [Actinomadura sp. KC216]|uniref:aspartate aminotransferase family protein n=1 Tax=Actinomadura sp. KC216 TaxID=2530370 RepID=UPI001046234E|nr:aspartate aminotransferase family protein [Actinomadura sp. KC216]TDB85804.1 aspartate aminotransferase family protein [Actinomadura sp. KC216]
MSELNPVADPELGQSVFAGDRAHVFHPWVAQGAVHPLPVAGAEGSWFWDFEGNRYLDFCSQLVYTNIGHQHPKVVEAIKKQADRLCVVAPYFATESRSEAARLITEIAPEGMDHVLFNNGGGESIEHAARMARLHTGRHKLLAAYHSFHGATTTAIHLSGDPRRWRNDTGSAGVVHFFSPYRYRTAFNAANDREECDRALAHLEQTIILEGANTIAAIVLETVAGTSGGVLVPPDGYLAGVRALCDRYGIMLILDEVMVGFGRTGRWFAADHWGVRPDLIAFAKGVNSGYVPLGGVIISADIVETFRETPYPAGTTYSGHPLATAAAVATINVMKEEGIVEHAAWLGENILGPGLAEIAERHPSVGDVRGIGAFWGIELVKNKETKEMLIPLDSAGRLTPVAIELLLTFLGRGVWPFTYLNRIHIAPPCNISEEDARKGLEMLDDALSVADAHCD